MPLSPRAVAMLRDLPRRRRWVGHIDEVALKIYVHIADEQAQVTMRQLAERRQAAGPAKARPRAEGHQHSFSTVTEVNNDALLKESWKQGLFDSTISNQRRGRDSNPRSSF